MSQSYIQELQNRLHQFAVDRDWEQFHAPKNLAMALAVEASELMEVFQWLTGEESGRLETQQREKASAEIADVLIYLVRLADVLGIDPLEAAQRKVEQNRKRYPVAKARGRADKYSELG